MSEVKENDRGLPGRYSCLVESLFQMCNVMLNVCRLLRPVQGGVIVRLSAQDVDVLCWR